MTSHPNTRLLASFHTVARVASALATLIGSLMFVSWLLDLAPQVSVPPLLVAAPATIALTFILSGISLWLLDSKSVLVSIQNPKSKIQNSSRLLAALFASLVVLLSLLTSLSGVLIGLALLLLDVETRRGYRPAQYFAFIASILSLLAMSGHVYRFYGISSYTGMTLLTAVTFLVLGVGVLSVRPDRGLMAIVTSEGVGGMMARRLFVAAIVIPSVLGWLRLEGGRLGLYDTQRGVSLLVISIIVGFLILIWWYAKFLNRTDAERQRAEEARQATARELEAQRTLSIRSDRLRSLGEMAAGIAHELNQPLVGVRGLAEHLLIGIDRGWNLTQDKIREKLRLIVEQADRMTHIIQHVRMFAREADKFERQPVQVNDVVRAAIDMLDVQSRSRGIELACDLADGLPVVSANPFSLEEVVLNNLVTARDATEERLHADAMADSPRVLVRTRVEGDGPAHHVQVDVIDQGVGIPESILPRVFDPFFTTKGPDRGTGLGLAISRSIIEQFGGTISIQSTPGQGTTVTVSLPAESDYRGQGSGVGKKGAAIMETSLAILLVDDEEIIHQTIGDYLRESGHRVDSARNGAAAVKMIQEHDYDLALTDLLMPGMDGLALLSRTQELQPDLSVVLITGHGNMETAIQALRLGAVDFLTKPVKLLELDAVLEKASRVRALRRDKRALRETVGRIQATDDARQRNRSLVGISPAIRRVRDQIQQAVDAGCETILITGETGTGKEVVAREIHFLAGSDSSPFIAVSCPAIPDSLIESELFGSVKGAFTGASVDRAGYFELAHGGTLFLDEIADLSASAQAALLRVLETRTLRRVGGAKEVSVDVRVVAATNTLLEDLVEAGKFRRDLLYRLNLYTIHLTPLRERREDILPLAEHFLSLYAARRGLRFEGFSPEAQQHLMSYEFPGNARELHHIIERAAILARSGQILPVHLSLPHRSSSDA
ncbi:MAG: sigma 54-interacting transcriptional regulator, partial [Candidatus Latescibacteria bacterium]|nr:sigma 54-interacting transcriptional regulator [Candidatus Latescibacterota bacterium]